MVLVLVASAIGTTGVAGATPATNLGPALVGALVWGIGLSLGGPTGYAINPARDLGPRLVHAILPIPGKGGNDWGYAWIPVVGPLAGGALAAWAWSALSATNGAPL
jgi:glycerol uptake facilitator protein